MLRCFGPSSPITLPSYSLGRRKRKRETRSQGRLGKNERLVLFIINGLFHAKPAVGKPFLWGWAPSQRICRSHRAHWHDSNMTRKTRPEHTKKKPRTTAPLQSRSASYFLSSFLMFSNLPGREYCSHAYKLAPFLAGLYRQAMATARRTEQLGAQLESYSPGTGTLASHWLRRARREQMLKLFGCGVFVSFSVCTRRSHTMLRATPDLVSASAQVYPMGAGARIRCVVGAALPRARLVRPRAKRIPRENQESKKTTLSNFSSGQPTFEAFLLLVVVVLSESLTSFHVVAKTVLDSL